MSFSYSSVRNLFLVSSTGVLSLAVVPRTRLYAMIATIEFTIVKWDSCFPPQPSSVVYDSVLLSRVT